MQLKELRIEQQRYTADVGRGPRPRLIAFRLVRNEIEVEILQNFLEAKTFDFGSETDTFGTKIKALYVFQGCQGYNLYRLTWLTSLIHSIFNNSNGHHKSSWRYQESIYRHSGPYAKGGYGGCNPPPLNLSEVKFSGSTFGSCTTVTAQFSSFVHQCGCSQF